VDRSQGIWPLPLSGSTSYIFQTPLQQAIVIICLLSGTCWGQPTHPMGG
jgi:hypothetical protein